VSDQAEIATRAEVLGMLTRKAREGSTAAAIALEEALRVDPPPADLDEELNRLLRGD
jgi:hypothetical protein